MIYDFLIVGSGIAGSSLAYFLKSKGKVAIIDKDPNGMNASKAAGAFLSPMIGNGTNVKDFINSCLDFSLDFYEQNFEHILSKNGLLRLKKPNDKNFENLENIIDIDYQKMQGGYFFKNAGMINSQKLCKELCASCDFFTLDLKSVTKQGECFVFGNKKAKNIILAVGANDLLLDGKYFGIRGVWGERLCLETDAKIPYNIASSVAISTNKKEKNVVVGSSHIIDKTQFFYSEKRAKNLLVLAQDLCCDLKDSKIKKTFYGIRPSSNDYLPIVGKFYDIDATNKNFPSIKNGTKIPRSMLFAHQNVYIHTGHGGRGFVSAPKTAKLLADLITNNQEIPENICSSRFVYRFLRRLSK